MPLPGSSRAFSPPMSTVSSTQGTSSPVHIKKVVMEGRSKHDGAHLKMYLKLSVAVDSVAPGASLTLFRENNIRITQSKVHPLDDRSVPYYYSSTEQPLLHKAAIALQLGTKSSRHYHTLFPISSPPMDPTHVGSTRRHREGMASTSTAPPNDERYTGVILVSGYNVTLVLPKEFPPRVHLAGAESDGDDGFIKEMPSSFSMRSARRSSSVFRKTYLHMMAGLEVFVPYVTTPPKGPFLVSIPVPRCLDNHIKLRISTPPINSSPASVPRGSFTSTSSEDDAPGWDFLTEPPVSRKIDKSTRKSPYQQSADDEKSDSPSGTSTPGTELIQGAYQSTDVLHVRWAPPLGRKSGLAKTEDGMRRVCVERTVGKMKCEVLRRDAHGITLGLTYDGVCDGLWHPGVATMLGMDIALDVKGRRVSWPEGAAGWSISGGNGFGGLHSETSPSNGTSSRRSSFESSASRPFLPTLAATTPAVPSRSLASLLRAPLPNQNTQDYSFESSPGASSSPGTPQSEPLSVSPNTPGHDSRRTRPDILPGKSVMLKINLLKLLPPAKNVFDFSVTGVVTIDAEEEDFVPLPAFRVLGSDKEKVDTVVALHTPDVVIQLGTQAADGPTRTLQLGEEVRCEDGVGLLVRPLRPQIAPSSSSTTPSKHRTPLRGQSLTHSPRIKVDHLEESTAQSKQPLGYPCVLSTVTPLPRSEQHTHCVRVNIPAYAFDVDKIEFGLAVPQRDTMAMPAITVVEMLYASYGGRYVHTEVLPRGTDALSPTLSGVDALGESQVIGDVQFWVVVHLEDVETDFGEVEVVYLVGEGEKPQSDWSKGKAKGGIAFDVLLPCFQQPISRYEVEIDCPAKYDPQINHSTLPNQHTTHSNALKLAHFVLPAGFFPVLFLSLHPSPAVSSKRSRTRRAADTAWRTLPSLVVLALLYLLVSIGSEVRQVRETINTTARAVIGGVPYSDTFWGDAYGKSWWWPQDHVVTSESSEPTAATATASATATAAASVTESTSWQKETVSPVTPTVNLADATPVPETKPSRAPPTRAGHARMALIPLPAVPFLSWHIPRLSPEMKDMFVKGFHRALHLLRRIIDFPLDPD